jgi:hypothetical protein
MLRTRNETVMSSTTVLVDRPVMSVFGRLNLGLEVQADDGNTRFAILIHGNADDRAWFARRLRELADEVDAWRSYR